MYARRILSLLSELETSRYGADVFAKAAFGAVSWCAFSLICIFVFIVWYDRISS